MCNNYYTMGKCTTCNSVFNDSDDQLNYNLFNKYGFKSEADFRKHSSRNKLCPSKRIGDGLLLQEPISINWPEYTKVEELIDEADYIDDMEINQRKLNKHLRKHSALWFNTTENAVNNISAIIINEEPVQWITLVAQPGSGKTAVAHYLVYCITSNVPSYEYCIPSNHITITTGMSDVEWYDQFVDNFTLGDGSYLWNSLINRDTNFCITHRSNFHKRIQYLINNMELLSNHLFIIDEAHFADAEDLTIADQLSKLGITEKKMIEYNIKVLFISATPDVNLSIMNRKDNHKQVKLLEEHGYFGFKYFYDNNMLIDYDDQFNIESKISNSFSSPRYHFVRARTNQEKGLYRARLEHLCIKNSWTIIFDDSDSKNNYYLSFLNDLNEKKQSENGKSVIKLYEEPIVHTIILIKNKYQASKRLKLTKYTGLITEKPAKKQNTTVTCNGLIPRFFGYNVNTKFINNEPPIFVCCKKSVEEYINFTEILEGEPWIYEGKDYTSQRIKSNKKHTKELKNTCYGKIGNETNKNVNNNIATEGPFSEDELKIRFKEVTNINYNTSLYQLEPSKYKLNTRLMGLSLYSDVNTKNDFNETHRLLNSHYDSIKSKHSGFGISSTGKGQQYVIYPVYENINTPPNQINYYFHYLKHS